MTNDIDFYVLQLAQSIEQKNVQKWMVEISTVISSLGGLSLIPGKIGRSEPSLRRSGAQLVDEPLDDNKRSGYARRVMALAEEFDVKVIFSHDENVLDLATQIKKKSECPIIQVMQNPFSEKGIFAKRRILKRLDFIDHFIVVSEYLADYLKNEFSIPEDKISVIYEGFDLQNISSQEVSQERTMSLAHAWGAVEDMSELVLIPADYSDPVWCSNLTAFAREIAQNSTASIRYVVIGDDDGSGVMQKMQHSISRIIHAPVQLAGYCADIEAAIKLTSTVLNFYSPTETQYTQSLIAQALGRFVFLPAESPSAQEFIHNRITGQLLPSEPAVIREAVESFVHNAHSLRDGNFVDSRSFILKYFSREEMHKKIRALFADADFVRK